MTEEIHITAQGGGKTARAEEAMATGGYVNASDLIPSNYTLQLDIDTSACEAALENASAAMRRSSEQFRRLGAVVAAAHNPWLPWSQYSSYRLEALRAVQTPPDPIGDLAYWAERIRQSESREGYQFSWQQPPTYNLDFNAPARRILDEFQNRDYDYSPDAHTKRFDLEATKVCWKKVVGLECGEPSDPDSETGICKRHREEIQNKVKT